MIWLLLAQVTAPQATIPPRDIVVVGKRLEDDLARCIARGCPLREDAAHSLALARQQFVDGEYQAARSTLNASLKRNRRFARADPLPVAALWRDKAKVEGHLGEYESQRSSVLQLYQTQKKGLADTDPERLAGLIELGDMEYHLGRARSAEGFYREALSAAERAGRAKVGAIARYRLASTVANRGGARPSSTDEREIGSWLAPLIGSRDPELASFVFPARLLQARIAEKRGRKGQIEALLASLPHGTRAAPRLISVEPIRLDEIPGNNCAEAFAQQAEIGGSFSGVGCDNPQNRWLTTVVDKQWIDIGFRIDPAGRVADAEVVRQSDRNTGDWADRVLKSVRSRRYAVAPAEAEASPLIRLERFTLTAPYEMMSDSRLRRRAPKLVIETVDLTPEQPFGS